MYFGFRNISIRYGKKSVVDNVSLEFPQGKIVTIIGQNGCGKSSLLKTVSHAVRPSSGEIIFRGRSIRDYGSKEIAKKIAYLPQVHSSPPDIDVRTLVSYGRYPYMRLGRGLRRDDTEAIDEALSLTGLTELSGQAVSTLSGGERQRAWIAMTICVKPEVLILDEPTTYLDISYQVEVLELVRSLNRTLGITIVMVLHDLNLASRYSDLLYAIKDRGVCAAGSPVEVITKNNLRRIFDIDARVFEDCLNKCPYFIPLKTVFHTEVTEK